MLAPSEIAVLDKLIATGNIDRYSVDEDGVLLITFIDGMNVSFGVTSDMYNRPFLDIDEK